MFSLANSRMLKRLAAVFITTTFFINKFISLRDSLTAQLVLTTTKVESEQLARQIAEEGYSDLEKEKNMLELELKDSLARHKTDMSEKLTRITQDLADLQEEKKNVEDSYSKLKSSSAMDDLQMKQLQDQLEAHQYFSTLYKSQVKELKEEIEEKIQKIEELKQELRNLQDDRDSLTAQLVLTTTKVESEQLARQIAEEGYSDLEKEKNMLELELKDSLARHKTDMSEKLTRITQLEKSIQSEIQFEKKVTDTMSERDDLKQQIEKVSQELEKAKTEDKEKESVSDKFRKELEREKMMKIEAINKLAEVMNRKKDPKESGRTSASQLRKQDKECRKLQQELSREREKYTAMVNRYQMQISELQNERSNLIVYMQHEFIIIHYYMPTTCDTCPKPLWHMFKPPDALECRRCHIKCHKDHIDREEACVSPCQVTADMLTAKTACACFHTRRTEAKDYSKTQTIA